MTKKLLQLVYHTQWDQWSIGGSLNSVDNIANTATDDRKDTKYGVSFAF